MDKNLSSAGERKVNCAEQQKCFQLLESILDGENIPESDKILKEKLEKCDPCYRYFHLEMAIKELLKTKCCQQITPQDLFENIRKKVQEVK
ncbi:anti-sigma factor [Cecembia lonarensis]|uniref:Anti-sigma factor n=1 Tax=Cecembia lonarensis (strain CCUG 58316 / KCTC 22772 / LW9) TaxID=1225176 RepID=K1L0W1_CECL9|nr:anti-sigma factor [Cecembia lonarensis]EKB50055.1 anti-sigma factor [Cecembia lonarensis LW9]